MSEKLSWYQRFRINRRTRQLKASLDKQWVLVHKCDFTITWTNDAGKPTGEKSCFTYYFYETPTGNRKYECISDTDKYTYDRYAKGNKLYSQVVYPWVKGMVVENIPKWFEVPFRNPELVDLTIELQKLQKIQIQDDLPSYIEVVDI